GAGRTARARPQIRGDRRAQPSRVLLALAGCARPTRAGRARGGAPAGGGGGRAGSAVGCSPGARQSSSNGRARRKRRGGLAAARARPRRLLRSGLESVTPSERRVAAMAADGMTNREIAQALFVTPRTVEVHLSSAYRKLGISSRSQLPQSLVGPIEGRSEAEP